MSVKVKSISKKNVHHTNGKILPHVTAVISDEDFKILSKNKQVIEVGDEDEGEVNKEKPTTVKKVAKK